jgi:UDP-3-O-[3-hydroxymyristoyl] N-acetylglucosamine deacetylase
MNCGGTMAQNQKSLIRTVEMEGVGLHTGKTVRLRVLPAEADSGIVFVRRDAGNTEVPASHRLLNGGNLSTTLSRGPVSVATVEHLLSALHGMSIDNARIELDGPEVPIVDGSALPFVRLFEEAGLRSLGRPRRFLTLTRPVRVRAGEKEILALPDNVFQATYGIEFPRTAIGAQTVSIEVSEDTYAESIAPARTFCLLRDVEAMRRSGLALGGSLDNALVVGDDGVLNGSLRFPDEFARHKVLDLVGDLALLGAPIRAHVIAFKGGHRLHADLVAKIMSNRSAWSLGTSDDRLPAARLAEFAHLKDRLLPGTVGLAG